jgi:hypothetical protein
MLDKKQKKFFIFATGFKIHFFKVKFINRQH